MKTKLHSTVLYSLLKTFTLVVVFLWNLSPAQSQIASYSFTPSIVAYSTLPISSHTVVATGAIDDTQYPNMPIGFPFIYNGTIYNNFGMSSNGFMNFGTTTNGSYSVISDGYADYVTPMSEDLQGHSTGELSYELVGTAPNRKLYIQWKNWTFFNSSTYTQDTLNFQVVLTETANTVDIIYGNCLKANTTNRNVQVGITGASSQYHNRTTATDWSLTTQGVNTFDDCLLSSTGPIFPANGLQYRFTPPPRVYSASTVTSASVAPIGPSTSNQEIVMVSVDVTGFGGTTTASEITVNTTGTTSLADITALKIYYTGTSNTFSTSTQFGATTVSPIASQIITDTRALETGTNYFWIAYDLSPTATLGNTVDAEVPTIKVGGVNRTPTITAPAGNRLISSPMTYVSSTTTQNTLSKVAQGIANNEILGITVVMSAIGAPVNLTQIDLSAFGTTDTANIENIKVWSTGSSSSFVGATQFGSTLAKLPGTVTFSVLGSQSLVNGNNYFWLTYDIIDTATIGSFVDGECSAIVVSGISQIPSTIAPSGNREIRADYCTAQISNATNSCSWGYYITDFSTTGATTNITNNGSGCNGNSNNQIYYPNQTLTVAQNSTFSFSATGANWMSYGIWIDYDQDGVFNNTNEYVYSTPQDIFNATGSITIPCSGLPGQTRMRVRQGPNWWNGTTINDPCSDFGYGETEDYNVIITANPVVFGNTDAVQETGIVAPAALDRKVLQLPITNTGCGIAVVNEFKMNTAGSTSASDIANAKLYSTGASNTFNTSDLRATVATPNGAFTFTISDTIEPNGTTYYWLAYDIAGGATTSNVVDARFDSVLVLGSYRIPTTTTPAGNIVVTSPMTYVSSTATQNMLQKAARGTSNNEVLGLRVVMSSTGAPLSATQLDFAAIGTTDTAEITNLKVWYTGNSSTFATTTQFGSTLSGLPGSMAFAITGTQLLANDTNYFWLTYDIDGGAVLGNEIDGECSSITINGIAQTPTTTAPAGSREIREEYCIPQISNSQWSCGWYETINFSTTGGSTNISNLNSGCQGANNNFTYYPAQTLTIPQNGTFTFSLNTNGSAQSIAIWIDYDQNGIFNNTNEYVYVSPNDVSSVSASITIPCSGLPGLTRMRVRNGVSWWNGTPVNNSCSDFGYGETEDYNVIITANPVVFGNTDAVQETGIVAPAALDRKVLQLPITNTGCGIAVVNEFKMNTAGSTSASDIANAKLYSTGASNTFNTSDLRATVATPNGAFTFTISDTIEPNGTTYYWLAYDIAGGATTSNVVDARFDSVLVLGSYRIPTTTTPAGNIVVTSPMTYVSSTATQNMLQKAARGTSNNEVLGLRVVMSSTGAPLSATQLDFAAIGTTDTAEITNLKVWYTGNSSTFATTTQFGSTLSGLPGSMAFAITGTQLLANDTNYFWLTYDIDGGAVLGNEIDGECSSITINGIAQTPTTTAPAGSREIREEYCVPTISQYVFSCSNNYIMNNFTTNGAIGNISNTNSGCNGGVQNYLYYPAQTLTVAQNSTFTYTANGPQGLSVGIWIDYDQDGVFNNTNERVSMSLTDQFSQTGSITVPCSGLPGQTRMRVRYAPRWWNGTPINNPCSDFGYGETEDYNVIIISNPIAFGNTDAVQQTGVVAPGTNNRQVLQIPVTTVGCGTAMLTELKLNTAGSTSATDIANAKLYSTGASSTFNPSDLRATVPTPSGAFAFSVTDTLISNGTTYYWLAYDISGGATTTNIVDARLDSIQVLGNYYIPTNTNPSGNVVVTTPMTYIGSATSHSTVSKVGRGTNDNEILQVQVIMSSTGAPLNLTQLDLNATGTTDTANIRNMKVWFTGSSSTFATSTQFGTTVAYLPGAFNYVVTGFQPLVNDTNYFWVAYDVDVASTLTNVIDAECTSLTIGGTPQTPTVTAPSGNREIRQNYCLPNPAGSVAHTNITMGSMNFNNPISALPYINNSIGVATTSISKLSTVSLSLTFTDDAAVSAWIDFNNDGVFAGSELIVTTQSTGGGGIPYVASFNVPNSAVIGQVRMRVMSRFSFNTNSDPCRVAGSGQAQDYTITILPAPAPTTYVWNQTSPASYGVASNWTPSRTIPVGNDKLVFNVGGTINVNNITTDQVSKITVSNNTVVNLNSSGTVALQVNDTLDIVSGKLVSNNANFTLTLGSDTSNVGLLSGTPQISSVFRRWINSTVTSYDFPIYTGLNNNSVNVTYTTPPVGGSLTARFVTTAPVNNGLPLTDGAITVNKAAPMGVWRLTPANGLSGGNYTGTYTAQGITFVSAFADLILLQRANTIANWNLNGTSVTTTGSNSTPVLSRSGMTLYGEMGVGGDSSVNPLPVMLTKLAATPVKGDVFVTWTTVSETNNSGFDVERSLDGINFRKVGFVKGKGNSNMVLNYNFADRKAFDVTNATVLYYRLRQVDFNGTNNLSDVVKVSNTNTASVAVTAYPNPFNNTVTVSIVSNEEAQYTYTVKDMQGKVVTTSAIMVKQGMNQIPVQQSESLSPGIYFLTVYGKENVTIKLVKTH